MMKISGANDLRMVSFHTSFVQVSNKEGLDYIETPVVYYDVPEEG